MDESDDIFDEEHAKDVFRAIILFPLAIFNIPITWVFVSEGGTWPFWFLFGLNLWMIYWSGATLYREFLKPDSTEQKKSFGRDRKERNSSEKAHLSEEEVSPEGEKKSPSTEPTQSSRSKQEKSSPSQKKPDSSEPSSSNSGLVYVLTHPRMPDVVKIGYTTRSAEKRAKELSSNTAVPGEFEIAHAINVHRPKKVEKKVHRRLSSQRTSSGEFFEVSPQEAARTIKRAVS